MRRFAFVLFAAAAGLSFGATEASAGGGNPDGYGIYTPGRRLPNGLRLYRYDPYSYYYTDRGYYPYFNSGYWVPRAAMKTRYRYKYLGQPYRYYPAWGYR